MKKQINGQKTHWLRNTLCVLIVCGILGTILSAILFLTNPEKTYASASIQFSFDGAAEGTVQMILPVIFFQLIGPAVQLKGGAFEPVGISSHKAA